MRLLSYNIHKGIGGRDRKYQLDRVMDVIEEANPDLICLQEVDCNVGRSKFDHQPNLFIERFKPEGHLYQTNCKLRSGGYGNLMLSRWPLLAQHQISIRLGRRKPRGAQLAVIETPEGPMQLVHWHLGLAEKERHWQVRHVLEHALYKASAHLPTLVAGDCNDWRNTLCRGPFAECGFEHVTHPISRFRSFPAYLAMGSLDKAYYRGDILIRTARIVRTPLAKRASDHLPLVVDFHLGHSNGRGS